MFKDTYKKMYDQIQPSSELVSSVLGESCSDNAARKRGPVLRMKYAIAAAVSIALLFMGGAVFGSELLVILRRVEFGDNSVAMLVEDNPSESAVEIAGTGSIDVSIIGAQDDTDYSQYKQMVFTIENSWLGTPDESFDYIYGVQIIEDGSLVLEAANQAAPFEILEPEFLPEGAVLETITLFCLDDGILTPGFRYLSYMLPGGVWLNLGRQYAGPDAQLHIVVTPPFEVEHVMAGDSEAILMDWSGMMPDVSHLQVTLMKDGVMHVIDMIGPEENYPGRDALIAVAGSVR